jgi:cytochrome c biogenesis protein CcdA
VLEVALALLAGVVTVASPCILPMLPILLGASVGRTDAVRPVLIVAGFVATFSGTALAFGASTHVLGVSHEAVRRGAIAALAGFGLLAIFPRPFERIAAALAPLTDAATRFGDGAGAGRLGGLAVGATLGVLWTPCAGPVLASILALVATAETPARAAPLLVSYAIGSSLPMLAIAYGSQAVTARLRRAARHADAIRRAFGVAVLAVALAMLAQVDVVATAWLTRRVWFPHFGL